MRKRKPPPPSSTINPYHPGLYHTHLEVRHDMDEWNRLLCRQGHERNITRRPGNVYGKPVPPQRFERDLFMIGIGKKDSRTEFTEWLLRSTSTNLGLIPPLCPSPASDTQDMTNMRLHPYDTEHPENLQARLLTK